MKKVKQTISLLLCALLFVTLVSCGTSNPPSNTAAEDEQSNPPADTATEAGEPNPAADAAAEDEQSNPPADTTEGSGGRLHPRGNADRAEVVGSGMFNITPQEYIDYLNDYCVEPQHDSRYTSVPDYEESGKSIIVDGVYLEMILTANDDGNLTEIEINWHSERLGASDNAELYLIGTIALISGNKDVILSVLDELDTMDPRYNHYDTYCSLDGALYEYSSTGYAKYNSFKITPELDA